MKSLAVINADWRTTLGAALTSPCGWLGLLVFFVSYAATDDGLSVMLIADVATMRPHAQWWAVFAACHLARGPIGVAERLADADVGTRAAAAGCLDKFGGTSGAAAALIRRFLNDDDLRVQLAAGYQGPVDAVAKVWTCWSCSHENAIAAETARTAHAREVRAHRAEVTATIGDALFTDPLDRSVTGRRAVKIDKPRRHGEFLSN